MFSFFFADNIKGMVLFFWSWSYYNIDFVIHLSHWGLVATTAPFVKHVVSNFTQNMIRLQAI